MDRGQQDQEAEDAARQEDEDVFDEQHAAGGRYSYGQRGSLRTADHRRRRGFNDARRHQSRPDAHQEEGR